MTEKKLASIKDNYVEIIIEPVFTGVGKTIYGTEIPSGFYRKVFLNDKLIRKYYFPNVEPISDNLKDYITP